jgi:hypothetical protein
MGYVYRYIDKRDEIIKYVGIVWSDNRTISERCIEHLKNDEWCNEEYRIEYIERDIHSRTDAEYLESHLISLYQTDKYYNIRKAGWGISNVLPREFDWKEYELPLDTSILEPDIPEKQPDRILSFNQSIQVKTYINSLNSEINIINDKPKWLKMQIINNIVTALKQIAFVDYKINDKKFLSQWDSMLNVG